MKKSILETIKSELVKLAELELENVNCPFMYGEVELPVCLKEEMDKE